MMHNLLYALLALGLAALVFAGARIWQGLHDFPEASAEVTQLDDETIRRLERLRAETKFQPHDFPPLGYTGAESVAEGVKASAAVNMVIDVILAHRNQPVRAATVSSLFSKAMKDVAWLATEDRERTQGYLLEIWYIMGFKGATGRFAYGAAFVNPPGYGEPLPPGWKSPTEPREIGN
jgi:hypothetical protein